MAYNVYFTERAVELRENLADYLAYNLKAQQGYEHFYDCIDELIDELEDNPFQFAKCTDPKLASMGLHKALFKGMDYIILFRILENDVYITGVYHQKENYSSKL